MSIIQHIVCLLIISIMVTSCQLIKGRPEIVNAEVESEELIIGDTAIIPSIKKQTSEIYNNRDGSSFSLTKKQLRNQKTYGTNIISYSSKGTINRIIATSMTKKGQLSTEWYFFENQLIHAYETFEYFDKYSAEAQWKNFKNIYGWESRYYFSQNGGKCQKHKGRTEVDATKEADRIRQDGIQMLNFLTKGS